MDYELDAQGELVADVVEVRGMYAPAFLNLTTGIIVAKGPAWYDDDNAAYLAAEDALDWYAYNVRYGRTMRQALILAGE